MIIRYILITIIGYLIGCFSTAYYVGKAFGKIDIRDHGSGNAGATNMIRVLGAKAGAVTFLGDALKGIAAVLIGRWIGGNEAGAYVCGIAAVIGHNWPVFLKFKGGKGIAASIGMIIALEPMVGLMMFAIGVVLIVITRYVSLASVGGALAFPVIVLLTRWNDKALVIFSIFLGGMALMQHRKNIMRLLTGTENKIGHRS